VRDGLHLLSWRSYGRRGDGSEEVRPVLEDHVNGDSPQVLEEAVSWTARDNGGSPDKIGEIGGGVEREGEQVERDEDAGESFFAVPEIVLEIISFGLEHVERLVLDLPSGAPAGREFGDVAGRYREVRDEVVVVDLLSGGVADLDGEPIRRYGVVGCAQRHSVEPTV